MPTVHNTPFTEPAKLVAHMRHHGYACWNLYDDTGAQVGCSPESRTTKGNPNPEGANLDKSLSMLQHSLDTYGPGMYKVKGWRNPMGHNQACEFVLVWNRPQEAVQAPVQMAGVAPAWMQQYAGFPMQEMERLREELRHAQARLDAQTTQMMQMQQEQARIQHQHQMEMLRLETQKQMQELEARLKRKSKEPDPVQAQITGGMLDILRSHFGGMPTAVAGVAAPNAEVNENGEIEWQTELTAQQGQRLQQALSILESKLGPEEMVAAMEKLAALTPATLNMALTYLNSQAA